MKKGLFITKIRLLCILFVVCLLVGQSVFAQGETPAVNDTDMEYLNSIKELINDKYKGDTSDSELMEGAIRGMFNSLDPYSTFFTPKEAESFLGSINGTYSGIGISMEKSGDYILLLKVFASSPAEKSGILQGDKIAEINGKSTAGMSLEEAASIILGEPGTKVDLGIVRNGRMGVLMFKITRETIKVNPVAYDIRNDIGYIKLEMFNSNTYEYLTNALDEMDKNKITKIILDLRGNPGGEVGQAIATAQKFITSGLITRLDFASKDFDDVEYTSSLPAAKYKLAVLVNGSSASASEIVAGAVQDRGAGKLIGTKTFGKAKVQGLIPILTPAAVLKYEKQIGVRIADVTKLESDYGIYPSDDELLGYTKITIGLYYTPNGRMIDGTGIIPDKVVADPVSVSEIDINSIQKLSISIKPALNSQGADVLNAEKILKVLGYATDQPDSIYDAKAFKAIMEFQKKSGLFAYGVIDFSTQKALNNALDTIIIQKDLQYAAAVDYLIGK